MTMTRSTDTTPRTSALDRRVAMQLAATEYDRVVSLLRSLSDDDWTKPSGCPGWDVRAMACHMLGMVEMAASLREQRRQNKAAGTRAAATGEPFLDALTGVQVGDRADMRPAEIVARFAERGPKAARGRRRAPGLVRRRTIPLPQDVGDHKEQWTFGYLIDVILTRDPWMHRVDITRATGAHLELTADHDGVVVADIAEEWLARHGRPVTLRLTGPAGGEWSAVTGGPEIELDAADFCAAVSGRGSVDDLFATHVPF